MQHDLSNRVALVTGASRGLGAAIALKLGACGAKVAVNYFGSEELGRSVAAEIRHRRGQAIPVRADVRDERQVRDMIGDVETKFGPVDVLVINATGPQPFVK